MSFKEMTKKEARKHFKWGFISKPDNLVYVNKPVLTL
jgi:hypothetical protein